MPVVLIFASPFWGMLSDRKRWGHRILSVTLAAPLPFVLAMAFSRNVIFLAFIVFGFSFFISPIPSLLDSLALRYLGEEREKYSRFRTWGAVGWGVAAPLAGITIQTLGIRSIFFLYVLFTCLSLVFLIGLPPVHAQKTSGFMRSFKSIFITPTWLIFLASIALVGICSSILERYFVLFIDNLGGREGIFGLSIAVATLSEVLVYCYAPVLLKRFGTRKLIFTAFTMYALRSIYYAQIKNPNFSLAAQAFHGPSFSALWAGGVLYAAQRAPADLGTTAQTLFSSMFLGIGAAVGALLGGILLDTVGLANAFRISGAISIGALLLFLSQRLWERR
jgi:PPP family 3-phenylpropionic acid transporter